MKICLVMIVKNESSIIHRCLDQLVGIVDYISICDTGSTDDTPSIVQDWIVKNKKEGTIINGKVHHHAWKNFGHNRTLSARAAQSWLVSLPSGADETDSTNAINTTIQDRKEYDGPAAGTGVDFGEEISSVEVEVLGEVVLMFLDADMKFWVHWDQKSDDEFRKLPREEKERVREKCIRDRKGMGLWKGDLGKHGMGMIHQWGNNILYPNVRFIRADRKITCYGPTHEYYGAVNPVTGEDEKVKFLHRSCSIEDIGDGGSKKDKFERDIRLLREGVKEEPTNQRYWFYLGNSYKNNGQLEEAIECYDERIRLGGWEEEIFMSYVYKGECLEKLPERNSEALLAYMKGYQVYPSRSESLWRASVLCRNMKMYRVSEMITEWGRKIERPKEGGLFIEPAVYSYLFVEEVSIFAYYTGKKEEGRRACEEIMGNPEVPSNRRELARTNLKYYQ